MSTTDLANATQSGAELAALLAQAVKSYDIRGLVGVHLNETIVEALGAAFVDVIEAAGGAPVMIGHDMRPSSPAFAAAFARGAQRRGADVVLVGLCSTDLSYYASGQFQAPAAMFTASHNPAEYNGIKLSRPGAQALSLDTGLAAIRDLASTYLVDGIPAVDQPGSYEERDLTAEYAAKLRSMVDLSGSRPLKVVIDAGNGMGGLSVPAVLGTAAGLSALPLEIVPLYFELDGTFPNHEANPLDPKNLVDLQAAVLEHGADLGIAFDGDADRCFFVDERGEAVSASAVSAIVAEREIARARREHPDRPVTVLHNLISSRVVSERIAAAGAAAVRTPVGHSLIKAEMARTGAVFGGEHSAHYYYRDFWGADNGMLTAMHLLSALGATAKPLSEFAAEYTPYASSGEINSTVADVPAALARVEADLGDTVEIDRLDGVTFTGKTPAGEPFWWANVRASNTEPLLRLNVEAADVATMERVRDRLLALIRAAG